MAIVFKDSMVNINCLREIVVGYVSHVLDNLLYFFFRKYSKCRVIIYSVRKHTTTLMVAESTDVLGKPICFCGQVALSVKFTQFMWNGC